MRGVLSEKFAYRGVVIIMEIVGPGICERGDAARSAASPRSQRFRGPAHSLDGLEYYNSREGNVGTIDEGLLVQRPPHYSVHGQTRIPSRISISRDIAARAPTSFRHARSYSNKVTPKSFALVNTLKMCRFSNFQNITVNFHR